MADGGRDEAQKMSIDLVSKFFINGPPHLLPSVILAIYDSHDLGGQKAEPHVLEIVSRVPPQT